MNENILYLRMLTPTHVGSGDDAYVVDMPIQREIITRFPKIDSSGLKGCFSRLYSGIEREKYFGNSKQAGEISILDARLLFFPIQSQKGLFALATCPMIMKRFIEDNKNLSEHKDLESLISEVSEKYLLGNKEVCVINDNLLIENEYVVLADNLFKANIIDLKLDKYNKIQDLPYLNKIAILSDDIFSNFICSHTQISTRNKMNDETGTTDDKGLFTEEYLPSETIMYVKIIEYNSIFNKSPMGNELLDNVCNSIKRKEVQIGGNKTLGKGIIKIL